MNQASKDSSRQDAGQVRLLPGSHLYEQVSLFEKCNSDLPICQPYAGLSLLKRYTAWEHLAGRKADFSNTSRRLFLGEVILPEIHSSAILRAQAQGENPEDLPDITGIDPNDSGVVLTRILSLISDTENQARLINFLYMDPAMAVTITSLDVLVPEDYESHARSLRRRLEDRTTLERVTGQHWPERTPVTLNISAVSRDDVDVFYDRQLGAFISVGYLLDPDHLDTSGFGDFLMFFKALGDKSRLSIVDSLREGSRPSSWLAEELGLALSTMSHHISILQEAGVIVRTEETRESKVAYYELNRPYLQKILSEFTDDLRT